MSAHTPGPWKCWQSNQHPHSPKIIYTGDIAPNLASNGMPIVYPGTLICEVVSDHGHMDAADNWIGHDNARLIAAAPELLNALKTLLRDTEDRDYRWKSPGEVMARIAIAKATGGAA